MTVRESLVEAVLRQRDSALRDDVERSDCLVCGRTLRHNNRSGVCARCHLKHQGPRRSDRRLTG